MTVTSNLHLVILAVQVLIEVFHLPAGYAFLLYLEEQSVQKLIEACFQQDDKLYLCVSSPTIKDKPVSL